MRFYFIFVSLFFGFTVGLHAQSKTATIDIDKLFNEHPKVDSIMEVIETYNEELWKEIENDPNYEKAMEEARTGRDSIHLDKAAHNIKILSYVHKKRVQAELYTMLLPPSFIQYISAYAKERDIWLVLCHDPYAQTEFVVYAEEGAAEQIQADLAAFRATFMDFEEGSATSMDLINAWVEEKEDIDYVLESYIINAIDLTDVAIEFLQSNH